MVAKRLKNDWLWCIVALNVYVYSWNVLLDVAANCSHLTSLWVGFGGNGCTHTSINQHSHPVSSAHPLRITYRIIQFHNQPETLQNKLQKVCIPTTGLTYHWLHPTTHTVSGDWLYGLMYQMKCTRKSSHEPDVSVARRIHRNVLWNKLFIPSPQPCPYNNPAYSQSSWWST